jgi:polyribonucleotide nucleotidyltransferase
VPKLCIGAIIGAKGKTIHMIQKRTNTSIDIDQRADPCVVSVQGDDVDAAAVWVAKIRDRVMRVMRVMNEALE